MKTILQINLPPSQSADFYTWLSSSYASASVGTIGRSPQMIVTIDNVKYLAVMETGSFFLYQPKGNR